MMQPTDFLSSADACLAESNANPHEAHVRSAISRAYYAAFHHAKQQANKSGIYVGSKSEHEKLILALQKHADPSFRKAGNRLFDLRDKRTSADYQLHKDLSQKEAKYALRLARTIIAEYTPH